MTVANNILESDGPLTPEDQFLLELLVDGELDDPKRRDLLLKLDRVPGGWRCCAVAFLESQCLKETLADHSACEEQLTETLAVSVKNIPDPDGGIPVGAIPASAAPEDVLPNGTPPKSKSSGPVSNGVPSNRQAQNPPQSWNATDDAPVILPLNRSGLSRRMIHGFDRKYARTGITGRGFLGAAACGFLLALLATGALGSLFWAYSDSAPRPPFPASAVSPVPGIAENALSADASTADTALALNESPNPFFASPAVAPTRTSRPMQKSVPSPMNADPAIQHVTLKSTSNDLDGISVPCVESDRYDPTILRKTPTDDYADRLRKDGHRVETVSEQLMFKLDDGRMLIVPVDTINVQYKNSPKPVIYQ